MHHIFFKCGRSWFFSVFGGRDCAKLNQRIRVRPICPRASATSSGRDLQAHPNTPVPWCERGLHRIFGQVCPNVVSPIRLIQYLRSKSVVWCGKQSSNYSRAIARFPAVRCALKANQESGRDSVCGLNRYGRRIKFSKNSVLLWIIEWILFVEPLLKNNSDLDYLQKLRLQSTSLLNDLYI